MAGELEFSSRSRDQLGLWRPWCIQNGINLEPVNCKLKYKNYALCCSHAPNWMGISSPYWMSWNCPGKARKAAGIHLWLDLRWKPRETSPMGRLENLHCKLACRSPQQPKTWGSRASKLPTNPEEASVLGESGTYRILSKSRLSKLKLDYVGYGLLQPAFRSAKRPEHETCVAVRQSLAR